LWARSRSVELYLGQTLIGCRGLDAAGDRWADVADIDEGLARLGEWMSTSPAPIRARVWLGSTLSRPFILDANCGARNTAEARELAVAVASDFAGQEGGSKVWLAPWRVGRPTLAVAISKSLPSAVEAAAGGRGTFRVASVRPWWNQVLDAVIERSREQARSIGWTLVESDGFVHGRIDSGVVSDAAFEARKVHDPDSTQLRRRVAVGWLEVEDVEHFAFTPGAAPSPVFAIGAATLIRINEAAA